MPISKELWKDIRGYTGRYQVSSFGRVRSLDRMTRAKGGSARRVRKRILAMYDHPKGYILVELWKRNISKMMTVHRLVAKAFHKNPHRKKEVNHLDRNRANNHKNNLAWATSSENAIHQWEGRRRKLV